MNNFESRKFIKTLIATGLVWLAFGAGVHWQSPADLSGFMQVFFWTFLDLVFLILIFMKVFFTPPEATSRNIQILLFVFFKLVCLGFLAITLKRLRNAPISVVFMGIGFIWIGPLVAGLISKKHSR